MKTLVLGASENPSRYSYMAINRLLSFDYEVVAVSNKKGLVEQVEFQDFIPNSDIDTVTMYLNPSRQVQYIEDLIQLAPRRIIFNPGAENPSFENELLKHGIKVENACTLVLLSTHSY